MTFNSLIDAIANKRLPFAFLIGAGISKSAGIPLSSQIIAELKLDLYRSEHSHSANTRTPEPEKIDIQLIEQWCQRQSWYNANSPYASLLERKYPTRLQRRVYFETLMEGKTPTDAHRILAQLATSQKLKELLNIFLTTNFDRLLEYALVREFAEFPLVAFHEIDAGSIPLDTTKPVILKLHGDYLYNDIANLEDELRQRMLGNMRYKLSYALSRRGLIVIGYSGSDNSIMSALEGMKPGSIPHGIYWLTVTGRVTARVVALIEQHKSGNSGLIHEPQGADQFLKSLGKKLGLLQPQVDTTTYDVEKYKVDLVEFLEANRLIQTYVSLGMDITAVADRSDDLMEYASDKERLISEDAPFGIMDAADKYRAKMLMVLGPAGSGKTTSVRYLALMCIKNGNRLPVFLDLERPFDVDEFIQRYSRIIGGVRERDLLFIADAVDQAPDYAHCMNTIHVLRNRYKDAQIVATCRTESFVDDGKLQIVHILPPRPYQIYSIVNNELGPAGLPLYRLIRDDPVLMLLARNPLYLVMMVRAFEVFGSNVPRDRNDLFDRFCIWLLGGWRGTDQEVTFAPKMELLANMAFNKVIASPSIKRGDVSELLHITAASGERKPLTVQRLMDDLVNLSVLKTTNGELEFVHQSLAEYFCARKIKAELESKNITIDQVISLVTQEEDGKVWELDGLNVRPSRLQILFYLIGAASEDIRWKIIEHISGMFFRSMNHFSKQAYNPYLRNLFCACKCLGLTSGDATKTRLGNRIVNSVISYLHSPFESVRLMAVEALEHILDIKSTAALCKRLSRSIDRPMRTDGWLEWSTSFETFGVKKALCRSLVSRPSHNVIRTLFDATNDSFVDLREYAEDILISMPGEAVIEYIAELLVEYEYQYNESPYRILAKVGTDRAVRTLYRFCVEGPNVFNGVAMKAFHHMRNLGGLTTLLEIYETAPTLIQDKLINALANYRCTEVESKLIDILGIPHTSEDAHIKYEKLRAALVLAKWRNPIGKQVLLDALQEPFFACDELRDDYPDSYEACKAFKNLPPKDVEDDLTNLLSHESKQVRRLAARAFSYMPSLKAVPYLISASKRDPHHEDEYYSAIGNAGSAEAIKFLIDHINEFGVVDALLKTDIYNYEDQLCRIMITGGEEAREHAASILKHQGTRRCIPYFKKALRDSNMWVRKDAIEYLTKYQVQEVAKSMIEMLQSMPSNDMDLMKALGELGIEEAINQLVPYVFISDGSYRSIYATEALAKIGSMRAMDVLLHALSSDEGWVRKYACDGLIKIGGKQILGRLLLLLKAEVSRGRKRKRSIHDTAIDKYDDIWVTINGIHEKYLK